jgi:hypothetical protein
MAEYLAASGSRKVTELTSVSGVSGSTSMPIVMGGSTVRVSHTDFVNSTLLSQANTFTQTQTITSSTAVTELAAGAINIFASTGNEDTFEVLVSDGNGIQFIDWSGVASETFLEVETNSGPITIFRDTTITGDLTASLSFSNLINTPTLVSGSTQIISLLPSGTVSGSSQIIAMLPSGLVSGSSQVSFTTISNKPTLVSSSQQIRDYGIFATTGSNAFVGNQTISGSITASLEEGYILVGNSSGVTQAIPTASFGSGVGFPFTGSAEVTGSLELTGSLEVTETISTQILLTPQVLTGQLIVPIGFNGMLAGPVSNGGELTIENGSNLVII